MEKDFKKYLEDKGRKFKAARNKKKLSYYDVFRKTGIAYQQIQAIEDGSKNYTLKTDFTLTNFYGI